MTRTRRLQRGMTSREAVRALSCGNREAEGICHELFSRGPRIDPDDFIEGWGPLRDLDSLGVWGVHIVRLYKDVCGGQLGVMIALLRAWQLAIDGITRDEILRAISGQGEILDLDAIVREVQAELPNFDPSA